MAKSAEEKAAEEAAKEAEKAAKQAAKEAEKAAAEAGVDSVAGIEVGDPQVLRPVELPLVVKPANGGEWANDAQAQYAMVLNGYAYKNPKKWEKKKDKLVKQLAELASNPEKLNVLMGTGDADSGKLSYKNKAIDK